MPIIIRVDWLQNPVQNGTMDYTWIEVDRARVGANIQRLQRQVGPDVALLGVIKANAYGVGAVEMAALLAHHHVQWLGVAAVSEGIELRKAGVGAPILVQSEPIGGDLLAWDSYQLTPTLYTLDYAKQLNSLQRPLSVHVKIDTGMNRLGVRWDETAEFWNGLNALPFLSVTGIFTHFANSDVPGDPFTALQSDRFNMAIHDCRAMGYLPAWVHAANSGGIANAGMDGHTMARVGRALYEDAVSIKSRVVLTKSVNAGEAVSYNSRFIPDAATHIAIVGTGYSDGLPSQVINPMVLIRGRRFNVVGTICMDMVMVDIGDSTDVEVGDEVVWVGTQDQLTIPMSEFCLKVGKNPREVMCNFGARCQTLFLSGHPAQA